MADFHMNEWVDSNLLGGELNVTGLSSLVGMQDLNRQRDQVVGLQWFRMGVGDARGQTHQLVQFTNRIVQFS